MKYYSTKRPIGPYTYPACGMLRFENFPEKTFIPEISREAWGWLEYDREITKEEENCYDLIPEKPEWVGVKVGVRHSDRNSAAKQIVKAVIHHINRENEKPADELSMNHRWIFKTHYFSDAIAAEKTVSAINMLQAAVDACMECGIDISASINGSLPISKVLTLSTCHINEDTARKLSDPEWNVGISVYQKECYGWWIYVPPGFISNENRKIPAELYDCLLLAYNNNCEWLCFDRDAKEVDILAKYEW